MKANRKTDICIFTIRSRVKYSAAAFQLNKMSLISTVSRFIHALSYKWNHSIIVLPYSVSFICFIILQHHFRFCRYFVVVVIAGCFCSFGTWTACTVCTIFPSFFFLLNLFVWFTTIEVVCGLVLKKLPVDDLQNGMKWITFTKEFPLHYTCYAIIAISFMP